MISRTRKLGIVVLLLAIFGCGGGGGGGGVIKNATFTGRILNVTNGGPINPAATVQAAGGTTTTQGDGSFQLAVPGGTTTLTVDAGAFGAFTFTTSPASGTTDVGDLWVGPQKVNVTGRVLSATTGDAVAGAVVTFAGQRATTNVVGTYLLKDVAYNSGNLAAFWGIVGNATHPNFFKVDFTANGKSAVGGTVTLDDIRMTPDDATAPPNFPFTIWGKVSPSANAPGTVVTLKEAGTAVRVYNVGTDNSYYFWVVPGSYTIEARKGALSADDTAILTQTNQVIRKDVTLH